MKVNRKKLDEYISYSRKVNKAKLVELDLSEYFIGDLKDAKEQFGYIGLSNIDFIFSDFVDKNFKNIKRVYKTKY